MTWLRCILYPEDVVVAADLRPLEDGGFGHFGHLSPATLGGALKAAALRAAGADFGQPRERQPEAVRLLGERVGWGGSTTLSVSGAMISDGRNIWVPTPRALVAAGASGERIAALRPHRSEGLASDLGTVELLSAKGEAEALDGWISADGLLEYLANHTEAGELGAYTLRAGAMAAVRQERRWGHERGADGRPKEASLTSRAVQRYREDAEEQAGVAVFVRGLEAQELEPVRRLSLGGDGHQARLEVQVLDRTGIEELAGRVREAVLDSGRVQLVTLGPTVFEAGWRPALPAGLRLVAAAVGKPMPVSGWDHARHRPKPIRWAVPAGTTYFLQREGDWSAAEVENFIEHWHLGDPLSENRGALSLDYSPGLLGVW